MNKSLRCSLVAVVVGTFTAIAPADEVTDWNQIMLESLKTGGVGGILSTRPAATVQAAVYDALNGIEQRYGWIHVQPPQRAQTHRENRDMDAAIASNVHAIEMNAMAGLAHQDRSRAHAAMKNHRAAERDRERASQLNPTLVAGP